MFYDVHIPRCAHIKTNGTQCGSPALREQRHCFFHEKWQRQQIALKAEQPAEQTPGQAANQTPNQTTNQTGGQTTDQPGFTMPLLEDADSVQVALMQVIRLVLNRQLDPKVSGLVLYALQTASLNLRHMQLEVRRPETVVIDPNAVTNTGVGADSWHTGQFRKQVQAKKTEGMTVGIKTAEVKLA